LIPDATGASYTVLAADIEDPATVHYCCKVSSFGCNSVNSPVFTVKVRVNPENIESGTGNFSGKRCFDIVVSDGDATNSCGSTTSRANQKTDFSNRESQNGAPLSNPANGAYYSGVQVYTFTPTSTVSKVRFDYTETNGPSIESIVPATDYSGNNISTCTVTVYYKSTLNSDLTSRTRNQANKVKLYAIYNDQPDGSGTEKKVVLSVSLQDCACCGAEAWTGTAGSSPKKWLNFMCHNLGANESLDPFVWNNSAGDNNTSPNSRPDAVDGHYKDIKGHLYQWGRYSDGHQYRNSTTSTDCPSEADYRTAVTNYMSSGTISYDKFYPNSNSPYDWISDSYGSSPSDAIKNRWGAGTSTDASTPKTQNDPCPLGWKVPSQSQWSSIFWGGTTDGTFDKAGAANTITKVNESSTFRGYKVGDALFLPAAGYRDYSSGLLSTVGSFGCYWSSTWYSNTYSFSLLFYSSNIHLSSTTGRANGFSVRCVEDEE
jgi:uncharacterized protein (TIGR02145 family)